MSISYISSLLKHILFSKKPFIYLTIHKEQITNKKVALLLETTCWIITFLLCTVRVRTTLYGQCSKSAVTCISLVRINNYLVVFNIYEIQCREKIVSPSFSCMLLFALPWNCILTGILFCIVLKHFSSKDSNHALIKRWHFSLPF